MILDDEEANPEKYKDKKLTETTDTFDEENSVEYTKAYFKKALLPKKILVSKSIQLSHLWFSWSLVHFVLFILIICFIFDPLLLFSEN